MSSSRNVDGSEMASTMEWCWVAAVLEKRPSGDRYLCTGTLIEPGTVLTTATCLKRFWNLIFNSYKINAKIEGQFFII